MMFTRGALTVSLVLSIFAAPLTGEAPQAGKVYRIGVLHTAFAPNHPVLEGLKAGLKAIGLEERRDVIFDVRFTERKMETLHPPVLMTGGKISSAFPSTNPLRNSFVASSQFTLRGRITPPER